MRKLSFIRAPLLEPETKCITLSEKGKIFCRNEEPTMVSRASVLRDHAVSRITRLSAVDTVRARIAMAIELGLLHAGERLPPDADIASALEVSPITARRALASLAKDGLVLRRRGKTGGTFVSETPPPGAVDVAAVYRSDKITVDRLIDERTLIETALVAAASSAASSASLDSLQAHIDAGRRATNWADYHHADERFHLALVAASGLDWAAPIHAAVLTELYQYFVPYPMEYLHESNDEHQRILDAIRAGDTSTAITECQAHIQVLHDTMYTGLKPPAPTTTSESN
jgi:DNA-binding FadR family transcriptional regulator